MNYQTAPILAGKNLALIYSNGNLAVNYNDGLIHGIEVGLLSLGANVNTFNNAYFQKEISYRYSCQPSSSIVFPEDSPLVLNIIKFLEEKNIIYDMIIGYFYDSYLTEKVKVTLRKYGRKVINYPLNLLDQPHLFASCLEFFDETWCAEEDALDSLRGTSGCFVRYVPMACDPSLYRPLTLPNTPTAVFVGSVYNSRLYFLSLAANIFPLIISSINYTVISELKQFAKFLLTGKYHISLVILKELFLRKISRLSGVLSDYDFVFLANRSGVSYGFNDVILPNGKTGYKVRLREYEATMCGLCHLAKRIPELQRNFVDRQEILLYDDEREFKELITLVASGDIDWRKIGSAARRRSLLEHTWASRLTAALEF